MTGMDQNGASSNGAENEKLSDAENASAKETIFHHDGENMPAHSHHDAEQIGTVKLNHYWAENIRLLLGLLAIWFIVSFGTGILFVEQLNNFYLGGYPLGFWFAQQGSIFVFIGLIFFYTYRIKIIERRYGVDDDA